MSRARVRLGTRGSQLSLRQTQLVLEALRRVAPALTLEVVVIKTAGDRAPDVPLERLEGIGFFAKELEAALLDGRCDAAIHSVKDLPTRLHPDLMLAAICMRTEPRDVLIDRHGRLLRVLPPGTRVATSSVRRRAQLLYQRPGVVPVSIRGNIDTRLKKLERGECDTLCLAGAGLVRMGWEDKVTEWLEPEVMLPAPGQGALAVEVRRRDQDMVGLVRPLDHGPTREAVDAERAFIARIGSGCRAPAAALATSDGTQVILEGLVAREDGSLMYRHRARGPVGAAEWLGMSVADYLLVRAGELLDTPAGQEAPGLPVGQGTAR
jgi:hydroxymethylbilane synthase